MQYLWGPSTNLRSDFCIENVFDPIFREKLTGASILEWSKTIDRIQLGEKVGLKIWRLLWKTIQGRKQ